MIVFDIETGPLGEAQLLEVQPHFEAPSNYKDPAKIEVFIADAKAKFREQAALDPLTGEILLVGLLDTERNDQVEYLSGTEAEILEGFRVLLTEAGGKGREMCGWNIHSFDLPFIVRRGWIHGLQWPKWIRNGRYFDRLFVDLMDEWSLGNKEQACSLGRAAAALGVGRKSGEGKDFARLFRGSPEERAAAFLHCETDLRLTAAVARKILLL